MVLFCINKSLVLRRALGSGKGPLDGFFKLQTVNVHISAAPLAYHTAYAPHAQDLKQLGAARMRLFEFYCHLRKEFYDFHEGPPFGIL